MLSKLQYAQEVNLKFILLELLKVISQQKVVIFCRFLVEIDQLIKSNKDALQ